MSSSGSSQRMPRGGSCSNCRHRRIKCDGALPRCSNCERSTGRFRDCEYPGRGSSQIESLEEQIAILESRIREQESSLATNRSNTILLRDPYPAYSLNPNLMPQHPSGVRGPSTAQSHGPREVPLQLRQTLLSTFFPYAPEFGFFLDPSDVYNSIVSASQGSTSTSPLVTPALMYTIFLLSSHLSTSLQHTNLEPEFLSRAVESTSQILSSSSQPNVSTHVIPNPPWRILQAIQSHVLLAQYYLLTNRRLEGKYSLTIAISLVLGTRMHRIRSEEDFFGAGQEQGQTNMGQGTGGYMYGHNYGSGYAPSNVNANPMAGDSKEESQHINAFWTVLALNSRWTAVEGTSTSLAYWNPGMRVDTPWPWVPLNPSTRNSSTIQKFLENKPDGGTSIMALHAKACILLEQAFELASRYDPSISPAQAITSPNFLNVFNSLTSLTTRFIAELPSIDSVPGPSGSSSSTSDQSNSTKRQLLVIHTLSRVALMRLYSLFENSNYSSSTERIQAQQFQIEAAKEAARMIYQVDLKRTVFIDPIMAMLWPAVARVLHAEIHRLGGSHRRVADHGTEHQSLRNSFDAVGQAMSALAPRSTLMSEQLGRVLNFSQGS